MSDKKMGEAVQVMQASVEMIANMSSRVSSAIYATAHLPCFAEGSPHLDAKNMLCTVQQLVTELQGEIDDTLGYARKTTGKQVVAFRVLGGAEVAAHGPSQVGH